MKKRHAIAALIILLVFCLYFIFFTGGVKKSILSGELQYSAELGWINWGHAKPDRTSQAFKRLELQNSCSKDTFLFGYSQKMKFKIPGKYVIAEYIEYRKIPPGLTKEQLTRVFLEIFISVSESFEKMQAKFPFSFIPNCKNSSFKDGDLTGNLLSFYMAVSGFKPEYIKSNLTLLDANSSLEKFKKEGLGVTDEWKLVKLAGNGKNETARALKDLIRQTSEKGFSVKVLQKEMFYVE